MKRLLGTLPLLAAVACGSQASSSSVTQSALTAAGSGRYLVVFRSATLPANADAIVRGAGAQISRALPEVGVASIHASASAAAALAKNGAVLAVGAEHVTSLPPVTKIEVNESDVAATEGGPTAADNLYGYQWDMRRIGAPALWSRLPLAGAAPTVAVLDVGVMDDHRDLAGQVIYTASTAYCSTSGGPDGTASYPVYSTLIDFDAHPDWSPSDGCTAVATTYEAHGTHVAGTIAAKFGGGRVVGVDPDARVAAYKVFDRYRYTQADGTVVDSVGAFDAPLFGAMIDAANRGFGVISMSLGSLVLRASQSDNASWIAWDRVSKYVDRLGAVVVASAGNEEFNLNGPVAHVPSDISTILSTSASGWSELAVSGGMYVPAPGSHDVLAFYSNFGASVNLTAPGGDCGPRYPDHCDAPYLILNDYVFANGAPGYAWFAGTSMATPHVSAVVAAVRALHPEWGPGQVRAFVQSSAQNLGDRQAFGHGMVDADAATR